MKNSARTILVVAIALGLTVLAAVLIADRFRPVSITISTLPDERISVVVEGAVATPGLVELPAGSRLQHAIDAAGGLADDADVSNLNMAARLGDGETVSIPTQSESSISGLLNINSASVSQLEALPGIGDVIAQRIVDYRNINGPFTSIDELVNVSGISPSMVEELRPFITVGP